MHEKKTANDDAPDDLAEHQQTNALGPGGVTADNDVGIIVSGQPAGGPANLGKKSNEDAE